MIKGSMSFVMLVGVFVIYCLVIAMITTMLWNHVMIKIFSVPSIDYVDALCLIGLSRMIFDSPNFSKKSD